MRPTCKTLLSCFAVLFGVLATPERTLAGTIRHDRADALYTSLATQFPATGLHNANGALCSATLIHPEWVLTAAHCVDLNGNGLVDNPNGAGNTFTTSTGTTIAVSQIEVPTGWNGNINYGYDIALMKLATPVIGIAPASIYRGAAEYLATVTMVGYGKTGTGQTGSYLGAGTRRAGNNTVDGFGVFLGNGNINVTNVDGAGSTGLLWDFDSPTGDPQHALTNTLASLGSSDVPLNLEYSIAPGDSGGGNYIFESGQWWLAGVTSGDADTFTYPGALSARDTYGDLNLVTRVSSYQSFIDSFVPTAVPEPTTTSVLALLVVPFWCRLRRQRQLNRNGTTHGNIMPTL